MPFNTVPFFIFLAAILALFYLSPLGFRRYILLAASYFFYGWWNYKFIPLLMILTVIDFTAGVWLQKLVHGPKRKVVLVLSIAANLGFLGFFKYFNFIAANLALLMGKPTGSYVLAIVLPMGISFHTFQSMSYVIDVYRGQQEAVRDIVDYALYICFFPQLVAGPIVRARDFFRDLWSWAPPSGAEISSGFFLLILGLTKKMAFADQFAKVANGFFNNIQHKPGALAAWCGVFSFGMQIYFDFSGYTDMAIGMAELLGFHFPVNFRRPYLAQSITDFWRRWHISLSTWLRDYLYIPLGGNRKGSLMTYRNLIITMLLGGLWHGASWNFLIWGGYHGGLLALEHVVRGGRRPAEKWTWLYPAKAVLTFCLVLVGWVFFRAVNLSQSLRVLHQMFLGGPGPMLLETWQIELAVLALVLAVWEEVRPWSKRLIAGPAWAYVSAVATMLLCLDVFGVIDETIPFIYFQF